MTARKTKSKPSAGAAPRASVNGDKPSYVDSIRRRLSTVEGLEAVFTWVDGHRVVHVVSVVEEHQSEIYDFLMPQEDLVETDNPGVPFDFHVRASQKRNIDTMIPSNAIVVFKR
jgi:hypothetical protein